MSRRLLAEPPDVVAVGVELFERTLADQGVDVTAVDWRPPAVDGAVLADLDPATLAAANRRP
jgi:hypothetical protein